MPITLIVKQGFEINSAILLLSQFFMLSSGFAQCINAGLSFFADEQRSVAAQNFSH